MSAELKDIRTIWPKIPPWARDRILTLAKSTAKQERWKDIVTPPDSGKFTQAVAGKYEISNLGRVRHKKSGRQVSIYLSALYNRPLHSIVCRTFHGLKPFPKAVARHLDGDSQNACATNLRWGTQVQNARDKRRHKARMD